MAGLREQKKQRTRETILRVARELFAQRGYHGTTVVGIAEAAGISKATLFSYFSSKEDILFADAAAFRETLALALAARPEGASVLDALRDFVVANLADLAERAALRERLLAEDEQLRSHYRARVSEVEDVVAAAIAGELGRDARDLQPRLAAAAVVAALTVATSAVRPGAGSPEPLAVIDETVAFLRGGLDAIRPGRPEPARA